ncbi:hypothetical protein RRG08_054452, partial [Elysia crispata]
LETYCGKLERCSLKTLISFPTKEELNLMCKAPVSTDAEWCWLLNHHGCSNETLKARLAVFRRVTKFQCQLKQYPGHENLLERVHALPCIKEPEKLSTLRKALDDCYHGYDDRMELIKMKYNERDLCWLFEGIAECLTFTATHVCGDYSIGDYVTKIFFTRENSNNMIYKCRDITLIQDLMLSPQECDPLKKCGNYAQSVYRPVAHDFKNATQLEIFCTQKKNNLAGCWSKYGAQCGSRIMQRQFKEELRLMELICFPDFQQVVNIVPYSALVNVARAVLDCEEHFLQIYPRLAESRGYLDKTCCRQIFQMEICIRSAVHFPTYTISNEPYKVLYRHTLKNSLQGQLIETYDRCRGQDIDECLANTHNCSSSKSVCQDRVGSFQCYCLRGFRQVDDFNCVDIDECRENRHNCYSRRHCTNTDGSFKCKACKLTHYLSSLGECIDKNECRENEHNCYSRSHCKNIDGSFKCEACKLGYQLNSLGECIDINECLRNRHKCLSKRHCTNKEGTYQCRRCKKGYRPDGREICKDIDECRENRHECSFDQQCENKNGSYECACRKGFKKDRNGVCDDIDECRHNKHSCKLTERCVNRPGTYECYCKEGFQRYSQGNCVDINECLGNRHKCLSGRQCTNEEGTYRCTRCKKGYRPDGREICKEGTYQCRRCKKGYRPDGREICKDIDECRENRHECSFDQQCENKNGSYKCACRKGFKKDRNGVCDDIDECRHNKHSCKLNERCVNRPGTYECYCKEGFQRYNQGNCVDINECREDKHNCYSRRFCTNIDGSFKCAACKYGYHLNSLAHCIDHNECLENRHNCLSRRYCTNEEGTYRCTRCKKGYRPDRREICKVVLKVFKVIKSKLFPITRNTPLLQLSICPMKQGVCGHICNPGLQIFEDYLVFFHKPCTIYCSFEKNKEVKYLFPVQQYSPQEQQGFVSSSLLMTAK